MFANKLPLIFGETTRCLWDIFQKHVGSRGVLLHPQIRPLLNGVGLFPTQSQIYELVHCACEFSGRAPVDHITFGEFCLLITELQHQYRINSLGPHPRSQMKSKNAQTLECHRLKRRFSVFLGGSCNPTTWRHDVAIPFFKHNSITFYNPQVNNWRPELLEIEDQAKQTAEILFFVVDNQTRSTASMVEAAYLAGCGRQLILVIKKFEPPVVIYGEKLTDRELDDLERSHAYLADLVERMSIPVFGDIQTALQCTNRILKSNLRVEDLSLADGAQPVRYPQVRVANELIKVKDVFNTLDTNGIGRLSWEDVQLAFRSITDHNLPNNVSAELRAMTFTFEHFCCLLSEFRYHKRSPLQNFLHGCSHLPSKLNRWLRCSSPRRSNSEARQRDIFLGGSCGQSRWRDEIAIPILLKHGISFYNPQMEDWNTHYIPLEAAVKDGCRLLLYVITDDTRAMTSMLEAGHFIGQGCNIVLCIQDLKPGVQIDNEKLSQNAVADYNRARTYLADLANRDRVPVFENVAEAVNCAVQRLTTEYGNISTNSLL